MASDWLYPLSSKSDYYFECKKGRTRDTGPASFQQMIQEGAVDDKWGAYKNWKNVKPKDRIWIYYGSADGNLGVVGLAAVRSVDEPTKSSGRATIHMRWDQEATRKLLRNPFAAELVRQHIPRPQGSVWRVEDSLARQLLHHLKDRSTPSTTKDPKGKYATGQSSTISYTPPRKITLRRRHDSILLPLKIRLESDGWKEIAIDVRPKRVDLAMSKGGKTVIVEAKTVSGQTIDEVRAAFSQLVEYGWRAKRQMKSIKEQPVLWALFEKEPKPEEVEFLHDQSILVSWVSKSGRRVIHSLQTSAVPFVNELG